MFDDVSSANYYDSMRRRRRWSLNGRAGLQGYAAFLGGAEGGGDGLSPVIGAETAAYEMETGSNTSRAIYIGVATGVLTFLVNRLLGKVLG